MKNKTKKWFLKPTYSPLMVILAIIITNIVNDLLDLL